MSRSISIEKLQNHLFETLEGLKNISDPNADDCEKVTIEQTRAMVDASGKIIDTFKLQLDAVKFIDKSSGYDIAKGMVNIGMIENKAIE